MNLKRIFKALGMLAALAASITAVAALEPSAKVNAYGAIALGIASLALSKSSEAA